MVRSHTNTQLKKPNIQALSLFKQEEQGQLCVPDVGNDERGGCMWAYVAGFLGSQDALRGHAALLSKHGYRGWVHFVAAAVHARRLGHHSRHLHSENKQGKRVPQSDVLMNW